MWVHRPLASNPWPTGTRLVPAKEINASMEIVTQTVKDRASNFLSTDFILEYAKNILNSIGKQDNQHSPGKTGTPRPGAIC